MTRDFQHVIWAFSPHDNKGNTRNPRYAPAVTDSGWADALGSQTVINVLYKQGLRLCLSFAIA
jgi:hypothetical protein